MNSRESHIPLRWHVASFCFEDSICVYPLVLMV